MCVICYKPAGEEMPSEKIRQSMWSRNPDGAGYMIKRGNTGNKGSVVSFKKGFMTEKELEDALALEDIRECDHVALHYRITTSGGTRPAMTHPFPVSGKEEDVFHLDGYHKRVMMHNGILSNGSKEMSDTQMFTLDILNPLLKYPLSYLSVMIADNSRGNRILVMDAEEGVLLTGDWRLSGGLYYSNLRHASAGYSYPGVRYSPSYRQHYGYGSTYKKKVTPRRSQMMAFLKKWRGILYSKARSVLDI